MLSTVIGLGPIGDFLFGVAWDLLAGRSLQEALINGVMSSMIGMAIRWLGEATGLIPTHVDAPHYRGTLNGDVHVPGTQRVRPNMDVDTRLSLDAETRINLDPEARARTARPADLEAQVDLTQRRTWYSPDNPQSGQIDPNFRQHIAERQHGDSWYDSRHLDYQSGPNDLDWRNSDATWQDALDEAFNQTGVLRDQFQITNWAYDIQGKSYPVEWRGPHGAEVSMDFPHLGNFEGPDVPHVGWKVGRRSTRYRGHIFLDWVPAGRPPVGTIR